MRLSKFERLVNGTDVKSQRRAADEAERRARELARGTVNVTGRKASNWRLPRPK